MFPGPKEKKSSRTTYFILRTASILSFLLYLTGCTGGKSPTTTPTPLTIPVVNVAPGTYNTPQTIVFSSADAGVSIYYTTDGTTPTTASTIYTRPITVSSSETLEAIAIAAGGSKSSVLVAAYTINLSPPVVPVFSPVSGTYSQPQTVSISDTTPGTTIYYTTNGTTPTTSSATYAAPFIVPSTTEVQAIAIVSGYPSSGIGSAYYNIVLPTASAPVINPSSQTITGPTTVTITDTTPGASILYQLSPQSNGAQPYSGPITITQTSTLTAYAIADGYQNSAVTSANYEMEPTASTPLIYPGSGIFTTTTISVSMSNGTASIYYTTDGTIPTANSTPYVTPITVSPDVTVQAVGVASGNLNSSIASSTYTYQPGFGSWEWAGGSNNQSLPPVYGTLGVASASNNPGGRSEAFSWSDSAGNLWLFGGSVFGNNDQGTVTSYRNDVWSFNPASDQWTWIAGSNIAPSAGGAGPSSRYGAAVWIDSANNLWVYGGESSSSLLSDLWKLNIAANTWTEISSGSSSDYPVYGSAGVAAAANSPGPRSSASTWTDNAGNLWLYSGMVNFTSGQFGLVTAAANDMWKYNTSSGVWTWYGGNCSSSGLGTLGSEGGWPANRLQPIKWADHSGNFWVYGGDGGFGCGSGPGGALNDLWKFNPSTQVWTWVNGSGVGDIPPTYGTMGTVAPGNSPGASDDGAATTDAAGNLWLFGSGNSSKGNQVLGPKADLWKFDVSAGQWTWVTGNTAPGSGGVYGTLGTPSANNIPGARGGAVIWIDSQNRLWLFGGTGFDASDSAEWLSDLWQYQQ